VRRRPPRPALTPRRIAVAAVFVLLFYFAAIGWRGFVLIRTGQLVGILLGLALLALPVVGMWAVIRELRFGVATEILAEELEARGGLPADDLPRSPGGRVDRAAADAWFEGFEREVEAAPESWEAWFRLACGYDAAGDRRRGREAMRKSIELHGPLVPVKGAARPTAHPTEPPAPPGETLPALPPVGPLPPLAPPGRVPPREGE
jgi:hypothetical protein